ncbi:putative Ig domain-containing protein [Corallococcus interemptor]|uniref:putative Ig domain-containing protein n=1 Tax=Corallococcus interemptor TaxID=2316720 RepID=UPI003CFC9CAF
MRHLLLCWLGVCLSSTAWAGAPALPTPRPEAGVPEPLHLMLYVSAVTVVEGGTASFDVAVYGYPLSGDPDAQIPVTVARTDGDGDLTVREGASLTFEAATRHIPQQVVLAAAKDADNEDGTATFTVSAPGLEPLTLVVTEADQDPLAPVFTTVPVTRAAVGAPYRLAVRARGRPEPTYALRTAPPGMSLDALGNLSWTPSQEGEVDVAVVASNGSHPDAELSFRLVVGTDQPPVARIIAPLQDERLSGPRADFSCECIDDVRCDSVLFRVDGEPFVAQSGPGPIYSVSDWDITRLAPGAHVLQVLVTDSAGHQVETEAVRVFVDGPGPDAGAAVDAGSTGYGDEGNDIIDPWSCDCAATGVAPAAWVGLGLLGLRARRRRS